MSLSGVQIWRRCRLTRVASKVGDAIDGDLAAQRGVARWADGAARGALAQDGGRGGSREGEDDGGELHLG